MCGSCLEQTTWLRRNFAVREQDEDSISEASLSSGAPTDIVYTSSYSVQAQLVLTVFFSITIKINIKMVKGTGRNSCPHFGYLFRFVGKRQSEQHPRLTYVQYRALFKDAHV